MYGIVKEQNLAIKKDSRSFPIPSVLALSGAGHPFSPFWYQDTENLPSRCYQLGPQPMKALLKQSSSLAKSYYIHQRS